MRPHPWFRPRQRRWDSVELPADRVSHCPGSLRAVRTRSTTATPDDLYLWLCQLRRGPYSYDWLDNFGRRSPRTPLASMVDVEQGDAFMTIFELVTAEPGRSVTLRMRRDTRWFEIFGDVVLSYSIEHDERERFLVVTIWFSPIGQRFRMLRRDMLVLGDLIMMHKQLKTLCRLAEHTSTANH